jgi:hypothetical protein
MGLASAEAHISLSLNEIGIGPLRGATLEAELSWVPAEQHAALLVAAALSANEESVTPDVQLLIANLALAGPVKPPVIFRAGGEELGAELEKTRARVTELENSLSWRVSHPLRVLGGAYLRIRRFLSKQR